jgi:site-specific DNA-methyltransferase (cytosine-N4-specific)
MVTQSRRFTYGDQFEPKKTPLIELLELCISCEPKRLKLQKALRVNYFFEVGQDAANRIDNANKMAMNCLLSLNAYRLIQLTDKGKKYVVTQLTYDLLSNKDNIEQLYCQFAIHILTNLEGLLLARLIENIRARGEQVTLEYLGEALNDLGIQIPPNSTYISTMRAWLAQAGVFRSSGYEVNWEVIYNLLNVDADIIDELYQLTPAQKHFLLSLVSLDVRDFTPSNKIAKHTRSVYKISLTSKNLVKDVLAPLEMLGLVETRKTTTGRGAKPHDVQLTEKGANEILKPLVNNIAKLTELTSAELNRPFEDVVSDLAAKNKHVKGVALELFAVWICRLLGLRFSKWRLRHYQATGGGEVDVLAASEKIVYSRWQIQCKNQKSPVGVDVIAKEVGLTFLTKADIIMVITTSHFARDAINYANQVTDNSRYYTILLEGEDIQRIVKDKTSIVDILNLKARRTFAKKEMGMTDFDEVGSRELETEADLESAIEQSANK